MGKSMKPGGGGRFAKMKKALEGKVEDPGAVAAAIGRKKHGARQMSRWAAAGRRKAQRRK